MILPRLTVLDERYAIGNAIGQPELLEIHYQAWNLKTEDQVVLTEFLPTQLARRAEGSLHVEPLNADKKEAFEYGRDQFLNESVILATIDHPNVLRELEQFETNRTAYRIQEHHAGATLSSVLKQQGDSLAPKMAITILMPVLEGLNAAHQRGLVHGGITPESIFLAKKGRPMLWRFRTAHIMLAQRMGDPTLVVEDGFAAPELYELGGATGAWTDVYGFAATLYRVITGQRLPAANEREKDDQVPSLLAEAPGINGDMEEVLRKALAMDPDARFATVGEFQEALASIADGQPEMVLASPVPVAEPKKSEEGAKTAGPEEKKQEPQAAKQQEGEAARPASKEEAPHTKPDEKVKASEEGVAEAVRKVKDEKQASAKKEAERPDASDEKKKTPPAEKPKAQPEPVAADTKKKDEGKSEKREDRKQARPAAERKASRPSPRERMAARRQRGTSKVFENKRVPVVAAVAVVVVVALTGAFFMMSDGGGDVAKFAYFKAQGDSLFAVGDYAAARDQYESALATRPNDPEVSKRLSEAEQRLEEVAEERFQAFIEEGDSLYQAADSLLNGGDALQAMSLFAEANKAYFEALQYRPDDPEVLKKGQLTSEGMKAALQAGQGQSEEGDESDEPLDFNAVRDQLYASYIEQGEKLMAEGDLTTAKRKFTEALDYRPGDAYAREKLDQIERLVADIQREEDYRRYMQQGEVFTAQGRLEEAKEAYQRALSVKPGSPEALAGLQQAEDALSASRERDQQYDQFRGQGDTFFQQGNYEMAISSYENALKAKPGDSYVSQRLEESKRELERKLQEEEMRKAMVEDGVYKVVEEPPQLIGGLAELHRKVVYPESAYRAGIQGRVYVQFVVNERGRVEDAEVVRGIGGGCDEEALRVIRQARFEPGKVDGKPVKARHTLFINFKIAGDSEEEEE